MTNDAQAVAAYVDAAAVALGMPLAAEHRAGVIAAMTRLAAFAADLGTVELPDDIEVAGVVRAVTAAEIAAAVRSGSCSATDDRRRRARAHRRARSGAERIYGHLRRARARARAPPSMPRLRPVAIRARSPACPFAAKNLFDVAGVVTRAGAKVTAGDPPAAIDADAVAALERAGAVLVGATNMDEFAYGFVTENAHDGATHNPHDRTRIAGGSSGGSAAAVAAELVPLALASDTNGSIRVPAALCGIFGIRPTYGTLSTRGAYPFVNSLDTIGPFARTAADLTAAFAALAPRIRSRHEPPHGAALRAARRLFRRRALAGGARRRRCGLRGARMPSAIVELAHARQAREAAFLITAAEAGELHARSSAHAVRLNTIRRRATG